MADHEFTDLRILVVEDESLVAMLIEDILVDIGCIVADIASRLEEAVSKASSLVLDAAILDVNLDGFQTYPVAEVLERRRIPFVFSTGYGATGIPEAFQDVPIVGKPFQQEDLKRALTLALASRR